VTPRLPQQLAKAAKDDPQDRDWDWRYSRRTQVALINACSPDVVLELVRRIRELEDEIEERNQLAMDRER
jgi:hypothetical protein